MSVEVTETGLNLIPAGYKQTEVGVIPDDWDVIQLGDCTSYVGSGKTNTKSRGEYPLYGSTGLIGSCELPEYSGESLLVARVGANAGRLNYVYGEYGVSDNTILIKTKSTNNISFFKYWLIRKNLNTLVFGSGQPLITGTLLKELSLPLPSNTEQTAIANVLSDVDALISELEKLIAKKQAIKTATMQQLLTGRTRLPQFALREDGSKKGTKQSELGEIPEDWVILDFGSIFQRTISKKFIKPNSLVSFVGMQDVTEQAQLSSQHLMGIDDVKNGFTYFERGDILVAKITPCFENGKGCHTESLLTCIGFGSTEFHVLRATNNSDSKFIYYWSNRDIFRQSLESEMVGSAGHRRVPLSAIANYQIPIPSKDEQTAIATILSDMDEEIQMLEQRLSKTRQIKQGMIQELLTGKTRLV